REKDGSGVNVVDDASKIKMVTQYMKDTAALWWRRRYGDIKRSTATIDTLAKFVTDFKKQFYPENAKNEVKSRLHKLKQPRTIHEYIKEFTTLVWEISKIFDQDSLFYFFDGLLGWDKTELERHEVKDLSTAISHVEDLIDFSLRRESLKLKSKGEPRKRWGRKECPTKGRSSRDCPKKAGLNDFSAHRDEDTSDGGSMGLIRILNVIMVKTEVPKVVGKGLQYVEVTISGVKVRALVDSDATHNYEAKRLGINVTKGSGTIKAVNSSAKAIHGVAKDVQAKIREWEGTIDLSVVLMNEFIVVLRLEFLDRVRAFLMPFANSLCILDGGKTCMVSKEWDAKSGAKTLLAMQFKKGFNKSEPCYLAVTRLETDEGSRKIEVPKAIKRVLDEFKDVMPKVLPKKLPPRREVDHIIKFETVPSPPLTECHHPSWKSYANKSRRSWMRGTFKPREPPYVASVLFQRKKDGSLQMCIDYREIYKVTIKNMYPIPLIADLFNQLGNARYFTKLDMGSGHTLEEHILHLKQRIDDGRCKDKSYLRLGTTSQGYGVEIFPWLGGYGGASVQITGCDHAFRVTHGCIRLSYWKSSNARRTLDHIRELEVKRDGKEVNDVRERDDVGCPLLGDLEALFVSEPVVETLNAKMSEDVPKVLKKDNGAPIIEDWKSNDEDESMPQPKIEKKIVKPSVAKGICPISQIMKKLMEDMLPLEVTLKERKSLAKSSQDVGFKPSNDIGKKVNEVPGQENKCKDQEEKDSVNNTNRVNVVRLTVNAASNEFNVVGRKSSIKLFDDPDMPELEDISIFEDSNEDVFGAEADLNNLESTFQVSHIPTTRIHKDHPLEQVIRDLHSAPQTKRMLKNLEEHGSNAFLYAKIKEEVYVCQPLRFEDPDFFDKVYKVEKALYGLHQAPRAWFSEVKTASVPIETQKPLLKDEDGEEVNCKKQTVDENTTTEAEYVAASSCCGQFWTTAKSKTINREVQIHALVDGMQVIVTESSVSRYLQLADKDGKGSTQPTDTQHTPNFDMPLPKPKKTQKPRQPKRKITKVPQPSESPDIAADDVVHKEGGDSLATSNKPSSQGTSSSDGPRNQDTTRDTSTHTSEDRLKHIELMKICTTLQKKVLDLEDELKRTKTAQQTKIDGLEMRVKKLEKKKRSRTHKLKGLYKVGLTARVISSSDDECLGEEDASKNGRINNDLDPDEDITLLNDQEMFDANKGLQGEEVVVEQEVVAFKEPIVDATHVSAATTTVTINDIALAKALEALKTSKPKIRGIVIKDHEEQSKSGTTTTISSKKSQDKGKAKIIKEPMKLKKKDQILFDEEVARKLQEEIYKQERLIRERARQKKEDNILLIETWEDIQAKVDANYQLAERLQTELVEESSKKDETETTQESSSKRAGSELEQESVKNQKIVDDKETTNLKQLVKIISEEDIAIDVIPLAIKTLIIDWKIYKERKKIYYQIIRADFIDAVKYYYYCWSSWKRLSVSAEIVNAKSGSTKIITLVKDEKTRRFWLKGDMLFTKGDRIYVSKWGDLRRVILKEYHDSNWAGHPGIKRTLTLVEEQKKSGGLLEPLLMPKGPWESVSMDFITCLPKSKGGRSIIVVVARFSKYGNFITSPPDVTADDKAKLYFKNVVKY
nr:hypothetical protein CTI12_AA187700 [Tanacetum cinerariifolium]